MQRREPSADRGASHDDRATPATAPQRPSPALLRLQRQAGNRAVSDLLMGRTTRNVAREGAAVQRDPTQGGQGAQGGQAAQAGQAGEGDASHAAARAQMHARMSYYAGIAYTNYSSAVQQVRSEKIVKAISEKEKREPFKEIALAVGGLLLPMVPQAILGGMAHETVYDIVRLGNLGQAEAAYLHKLVTEKLGEKVVEGVTWAKGTLGTQPLAITGETPLGRLWSYLDGLQAVSAKRFTDLFDATSSFSDIGLLAMTLQLRGLADDRNVYLLQLQTRADHFMETIGSASKLPLSNMVAGEDQMALVNAYGRERWAMVATTSTGAWAFKRWLSPDMEEVATAVFAGKEPPRLSASLLAETGHLPAPGREAADEQQERRVVKMDAWGRFRYAWVHLPYGVASSDRYQFEGWIPKSKEGAVYVYNDLQTGGIRQVSPSVVYGMTTPVD
jgi:hypothetical protein